MFIIRHHKFIIGLILALVAISFVFIPKLKVEYDFQSFFIEGDNDLEFYNDYLRVFGSEDNVLLVAIHNEKGIYKHDLLDKIHKFTFECKRLPHVIEANSITNMRGMKETPLGMITFPLLHFRDTLSYSRDSTRIAQNPMIRGWFVSQDAKSTKIILEVDQQIDKKSSDKLIYNLDILIDSYAFPETHIAGTMNYETRYFRMIDREIQLNILLCALVIILSLILIFRTLSGVLIPAITVLIAMILLYGVLGMLAKPLDVLSTLFPTIILVVGTSNLIHILSKYKDLLAKDIKKVPAIIETFKELRVTIFLTSLTTAIGFFSLSISSMKPFRDFGIEAGIGVLIAFIVSIAFVPSVLVNIKPSSIYKKRKATLLAWSGILDGIYYLVNRNPKRVIFISLIVLIVSVIGIFRIDTNTYILSNFSKQSSLRKDFYFFEKNFSGVRIYEMAIQLANGDSITDLKALREIDKMHSYLEGNPDFGIVFSPVTIFKYVNQVSEGGVPSAFNLPNDESVIREYDKKALSINRTVYYKFIDSTKTMGKIIARMKDIGSDRMKVFKGQTENWITNNIDTDIVSFRVTGAAFLADKSNDYLSRNMLLSLLIAFIVVSIIMFLLFMNFNMVIISLIPNILPLVVIAGIIGFSGIILNGPIAIIFTIGFVIAVDDTIHFLSKFKFELSKGQSIHAAIQTTMRETGKAIIITTIILFFGFIVLLHSDIKEVFYQGLLVGIMLITALIADLFLLPVLLVAFLGKRRKAVDG